MDFETLVREAHEQHASDLILVAGRPPCVYVHRRMQALDTPALEPDTISKLLLPMLSEPEIQELEHVGDVDFSRSLPGMGRVRINLHKQRGTYAAAVRFVNTTIPTFEELNLPSRLADLACLPRGLVLVTGATGSGKSTTLAAMIEYMNKRFDRHVISLEDPIEFLFKHDRCVIEQRQIGEDSPSFAHALRHVVRQKPDVILLGEMRDHETIATALTAAETGHLVLGTLHTNSAGQTIERITDVFEASQQSQIRVQLANTLQAVVCQSLLRRSDHDGVIPAVEIMTVTPAIRRVIRDRETHLIPGMIETGQKHGMCTLDQSLADLVAAGAVQAEEAMAHANDPDKLSRMIGRVASPSSSTPKRSSWTDPTGAMSDAEVESLMLDG